ncbi:MAG: tRNA (adenosine(37)-N6)-dimethylallyltransferase MiaA [Candidatus Firestonebacteria bacterium]
MLIVIVGPTGVGKTGISIKLAQKVKGEIISADSLQIYKELNIGTAKPTKEQRNIVKHYLIDVYKPVFQINAFNYAKKCRKIIKSIIAHGQSPIMVGGTGLYIKAAIDGIFESPPPDKNIRELLERDCENNGLEFLYNELKRVDEISARKIHKNDKFRIIRALEVYKSTGTPISKLQQFKKSLDGIDIVMIGIEMDRIRLYKRINDRVDLMIKNGLVEEVEKIIDKYKNYKNIVALKGLGYRHMHDYLHGKYSLISAINLMKKDTRKYAKRQMTWFKKDKRIIWITYEENIDDNVDEILNIIQNQRKD